MRFDHSRSYNVKTADEMNAARLLNAITARDTLHANSGIIGTGCPIFRKSQSGNSESQ